MSNSLRHLNALRAFESVARNSSVSKAANELKVSHSVVSKHIKNLEEAFDTKLFTRSGNRIELNENGWRLFPRVANAFQILRDAVEEIEHNPHYNKVTILAEPAISFRWLRKKISLFNHQYPSFEMHLIPSLNVSGQDDQHVDIVIHFEERLLADTNTLRRLFPIDAFPACSPKMLDRIDAENELSDISSLPLIHDNGRQTWQQWYQQYLPGDNSWTQGKVYTDFSMAIDAAIDGEGILLADEVICRRELENGDLIKLDDRVLRCTWYTMSLKPNLPPAGATMVFYNWLMDQSPSSP
ncbi:LysR family transcriptional regulator [Vibrio parahaemolyticus]|uniref:LysR family transcriptional regulator n=1 Tax=Vibrio fluvialis TaxID=676 RepID=UPI0015980BD4|nr:LysR family transcriptional regulator [Vibrio fluvialis]EGR3032793.1 LysR family transcriptional regulator [Vibrio parahaemolyticus]EJR0962130.1 LysR family transcriptional regulator [Vibrio parahaemolyticus]QKE37193.1 LysR family transcriptional regulator [Vibrio fluvialis]